MLRFEFFPLPSSCRCWDLNFFSFLQIPKFPPNAIECSDWLFLSQDTRFPNPSLWRKKERLVGGREFIYVRQAGVGKPVRGWWGEMRGRRIVGNCGKWENWGKVVRRENLGKVSGSLRDEREYRDQCNWRTVGIFAALLFGIANFPLSNRNWVFLSSLLHNYIISVTEISNNFLPPQKAMKFHKTVHKLDMLKTVRRITVKFYTAGNSHHLSFLNCKPPSGARGPRCF